MQLPTRSVWIVLFISIVVGWGTGTVVVKLMSPQDKQKTIKVIERVYEQPEEQGRYIKLDKTDYLLSRISKVSALLGRCDAMPKKEIPNYASLIVKNGLENSIDPLIIACIVYNESRGSYWAISGDDAIGLMQVHLATWRTSYPPNKYNWFDEETNIRIGCEILRKCIDARKGNLMAGIEYYAGRPDYPPKVMALYNEYK